MINNLIIFLGIFLKNYLLFGTGYVIGHVVGLSTNGYKDLITFKNVLIWFLFYPYCFAKIFNERFKK